MRSARRTPGTVIAGVGIAVAVLLGAVGGTVAWRSYTDEVSDEHRQVQDEAARSAELIQRYLLGQIRTLQGAAPSLRGVDRGEAERFLEDLQPSNLGFSGGVGLSDAEGRLRASSSPLEVPDRLSDEALLTAIAAGISYDVGAASTYGGRTPPLLPMAVSLSEGTDRGALVGWVRLDTINSQLAPFRADDQTGYLIDRAGQVIAEERPVSDLRVTPNAASVAAEAEHVDGSPLSAEGVSGLSGDNRLLALSTVPLCGCTVVIERPMRSTIDAQRAALVRTMTALLVAVILLGAGVVRLGRDLNAQQRADALARERAARLQSLSETLPRGRSATDVTDRLTAAVIEGVDATRASAVILPRSPAVRRDVAQQPNLTPLEQQALDAGDLVVISHMEHGGKVDAAALPMRVGRRTHGILELRWNQSVVLSDEASDYLRSIARQGAVALERAERQANDQVQRRRVERLQRALAVIARASTREEVLDAVRAHCIPAIDAVSGGVVDLPGAARPGARADVHDDHVVVDGAPRSGTVTVDRRLWPLVRQAEQAGHGILLTLDQLRQSDPDAAGALVREGAGMVGAWPVIGTRRRHGTLLILMPDDDDPREEAPTRLGALAVQLAQALDRAEVYDVEHEIARTLQRSLIELEPPSLPQLTLLTYYRAAAESMDVGGDWFDAVVVDDDDLRVLIGDLVGHGLTAAAAMGRLRGTAHALAGHLSPAGLLKRLDETAVTDRDCFMSTVAAVRVSPGHQRISYAIAGHPPPLLIDPHGQARLLRDGVGPPLGVAEARGRAVDVDFTPGCSLLLYTDGLVERRGEPLDEGLGRLVRAANDAGRPGSEDWLPSLVEAVAGTASDDDIAAILLTPEFSAADE